MNYLARAWQQWIKSPDGKKCADPLTLGASFEMFKFLENRLWNAFMAGAAAEREQPQPSEPEGRVIHPAIIPVTCRCEVPQPHVHSNRDHWCNACNGYLGDHGYHKTGVCICPPCDAPGEACTPIYSIRPGAKGCEICCCTFTDDEGLIHFSHCKYYSGEGGLRV